MSVGKLVVYLLRRDLRVSDNPILHHLATSADHGFTHLLPIYVFPCHQVEVSGFLKDGEESPHPPAVSQVGKFWRCGPHRAKFTAQSVWDLKNGLEEVGSGLALRVGSTGDVLMHVIQHFNKTSQSVGAVWMTDEPSAEEVKEQEDVAAVCADNGVDFKLWSDEKYLIDDRDTGLDKPQDLPDVFTTYRKFQEPLREKPRQTLAPPTKSSLPLMPSSIPSQHHPFEIPDTLEGLEARLLKPLNNILDNPPKCPDGAPSAHPFQGGERYARERLRHLITSGVMTSYKDTRNGLLGPDFSTKLSGYLSMGCVTARQVHEELVKLEDGTETAYEESNGYGQGENEGTKSVRFELLWRDYMRLCTYKFGCKLFRLSGFRHEDKYVKTWKTGNKDMAAPDQDPAPEVIDKTIKRFLEGRTGMGLIDAAQRELFHTGYTSNRARQNVASFFAKHLGIDWRYGAEWYEMLLVDYDVSSNWSNWQYVAGVGNDPRGDARIFNPVKQAFDYDKSGDYVRTWVPEVKGLEKPENVFQPWTTSREDLDKHGLADSVLVTDPVKRIEFMVDRKPKGTRRPFPRKRGQGRGGGGSGGRRDGNSGRDSGGGSSSNDAPSDAAAAVQGAGSNPPSTNTPGNMVPAFVQPLMAPASMHGSPSGAFPAPGPPAGYGTVGWFPGPSRGGRGGNSYYRGGGRPGYNGRGAFRGSYGSSPPPIAYSQPFPPQYPGHYSPNPGPPPPPSAPR